MIFIFSFKLLFRETQNIIQYVGTIVVLYILLLKNSIINKLLFSIY